MKVKLGYPGEWTHKDETHTEDGRGRPLARRTLCCPTWKMCMYYSGTQERMCRSDWLYFKVSRIWLLSCHRLFGDH